MTTYNYKLIIFDLDGTLIDTMGAFADIAGELISEHYGLTFEQGRKRYLETSGIPFFKQLDILFPGNSKNKRLADTFETRKIASFSKEHISENVIETLENLKKRGYYLAISSNNLHALVRDFVDRERVPVDVRLGYKPNFSKGLPHFTFLQNYFRVHFSDMLFVGDSLKDAQISQNCGVAFIGKLGTFTATDFKETMNSHFSPVINGIHELIHLLEKNENHHISRWNRQQIGKPHPQFAKSLSKIK